MTLGLPDDGTPEPKPGDWMLSRGRSGRYNSAYIAVSVRRVNTRKPERRFRIEMLRDEITPEIRNRAAFWFEWGRR